MVRRKLLYQEEPGEAFRRTLWRTGTITPWQLLRIAVWKSAAGYLGHLAMNSPETIEEVTSRVVQTLRPYEEGAAPRVDEEQFWARTNAAIGSPGAEGLRSLHGVALPLASAVLCTLNPRVWPVIDRRAWSSVFTGRVPNRRDAYGAYLMRLFALDGEHPGQRTVHELDQALMNNQLAVEQTDWRSWIPRF